MVSFKRVLVIYNPNSTRDSRRNAEDFAGELSQRLPDLPVETIATKYAGHAEEIAREYADDADTLLVSSSGDGGYNEVVNGAMDGGGKVATAVLPSGNANDHHAAIGSESLTEDITAGNVTTIELMELSGSVNGRPWRRFAHSYIGFGLTPEVGQVLTERRPNALTEKWYVLKHALTFRHSTFRIDGKKRRYSNLVFATINRMSKVVKLDQDASTHDGKMEVYETEYVSLFGLIKVLLIASTTGINHTTRVTNFMLSTTRSTKVQLDGEVYTLDADTDVTIVCHKDMLRTVR